MSDRPIIFSAPMVRALLDDRKTQTRRVLKPQPGPFDALFSEAGRWWTGDAETGEVEEVLRIPYAIGDRLWVREAFSYETLDVDRCGFMPPWYWADGNPASGDFTRPKPSIHMPRWASRLTLLVTDVRVQRLHEISDEDANAEGAAHCDICNDVGWLNNNPDGGEECGCCGGGSYRDEFRDLWNSIHGPGAWAENPWVAAISFDVKRGNIDTPSNPDEVA